MTTANELREQYLQYFAEREHARVGSSPIVPTDDPTMLFTSAGMVQFKPLYAGLVDPLPYTRATTCQKCLRAGGKGSDLENVGKTLRHHTFFEMLGNFSFGDYFKREALEWGWDFIWNVMKLPKDRLWGTTYEDDDEAVEILEKEIGIPRDRIIPLDAKENFWGPAGDTGACGPCSEVCFFMGTDAELEDAKKQSPEVIAKRIVEEGDLFLEIWNMVFPQFDQQLDGSRPPLKNRGIDTGAGLERMTTALQFIETGGKVGSPYETDLLRPIIDATSQAVGVPYSPELGPETDRDPRHRFWINAIADHVRALTFTLSEGLVPSNEGRGYVLRRIMRRGLRFGYLMGKDEPFMHTLVDPVIEVMGGVYPEITKRPDHVAEVIRIEEERFLRTVAQGSSILDTRIAQARDAGSTQLAGSDAFELHATYGFPPDLTAEIAEEAGLMLDREGYQAAMKGHQDEARKSWKGAALGDEAHVLQDVFDKYGETDFLGYEAMACDTRVVALVRDGKRVDSLATGEKGTVVLEQSPFYAESGGQVGDTGRIVCEGGEFEVTDTQKTPSGIFLHRGTVAKGEIAVDASAKASVDTQRRLDTMRNHSVTHLLQAALRHVVGEHITQSGSWVGPTGMRFDFSHTHACTAEQLSEVERLVNEMILVDHTITVEEMGIDAARERGAIAPFGEKYGHRVRVVTMGDVSMELCGGTHLDRTGRIGSFRLVGESSVAAGIRRIEGVTGRGAYAQWAATRDVVTDLTRALAVKEGELADRVTTMQDEIKKLGREIKKLKTSGGSGPSADDLVSGAREVNGVKIITARVDDADSDQLRTTVDRIRDKVGKVVVVLGATDGKKVTLVCGVSKDETSRVKAGDIVKQAAAVVGGGGGGRPDFAQAGGKQPEKLDEALQKAAEIVEGALA